MTRIYQLDTISTSSLNSTYLTVGEDSAGDDTVRITLGQLLTYLFNGAAIDSGEPFNGLDIAIGQVTSNGEATLAIGFGAAATEVASIAIGIECTASAPYSNVLGFFSTASGPYSSAFGNQCSASGYYATALGIRAVARVAATTNVAGPIIVRGDNGDNFSPDQQFMFYSGVQNVFMTGDIDLTQTTFSITAAAPVSGSGTGYSIGDTVSVNGGNNNAILTVASVDDNGAPTSYTITVAGSAYTAQSNVSTTIISSGDGDGAAQVNTSILPPIEIDLPDYCLFYPDEVGIILNNTVTDLTVQPVVSYGDSDTSNLTLSSFQTSNLINLNSREIFTTLASYDGLSSLTFSLNSPATATYCHGRAYWKGILVENTPPGS